jgi:hypothetical protein
VGQGMCHVWNKSAYKGLVGKSEGKKRLRRSKHAWEDNIKIDIE